MGNERSPFRRSGADHTGGLDLDPQALAAIGVEVRALLARQGAAQASQAEALANDLRLVEMTHGSAGVAGVLGYEVGRAFRRRG